MTRIALFLILLVTHTNNFSIGINILDLPEDMKNEIANHLSFYDKESNKEFISRLHELKKNDYTTYSSLDKNFSFCNNCYLVFIDSEFEKNGLLYKINVMLKNLKTGHQNVNIVKIISQYLHTKLHFDCSGDFSKIAMIENTSHILGSSYEYKIYIFDAKTGNQINTFVKNMIFAQLIFHDISSDGCFLALLWACTLNEDRCIVELIDLRTNQIAKTIETKKYEKIKFNKQATKIAAIDADGNTFLYPVVEAQLGLQKSRKTLTEYFYRHIICKSGI